MARKKPDCPTCAALRGQVAGLPLLLDSMRFYLTMPATNRLPRELLQMWVADIAALHTALSATPTPEPTTPPQPALRQSLEDAAENADKLPPWVHELANSREQVRCETYGASPQQEQLSPVAGQSDLDWLAQAIQKATLDAERQWVLGVLVEADRHTEARYVRQKSATPERYRLQGELRVIRALRQRLSQPQKRGGDTHG